MERHLAASPSDQARQSYDTLMLSVSALQLSFSAAEQVEFLTDAIDACERTMALCDQIIGGAESL
jgi:hypothetical protein